MQTVNKPVSSFSDIGIGVKASVPPFPQCNVRISKSLCGRMTQFLFYFCNYQTRIPFKNCHPRLKVLSELCLITPSCSNILFFIEIYFITIASVFFCSYGTKVRRFYHNSIEIYVLSPPFICESFIPISVEYQSYLFLLFMFLISSISSLRLKFEGFFSIPLEFLSYLTHYSHSCLKFHTNSIKISVLSSPLSSCVLCLITPPHV